MIRRGFGGGARQRAARGVRSGWGARGRRDVLLGGLLCAGLLGGVVSPVWAEAGEPAGEVELGSFALGDGLEGLLGEVDGSWRFSLPAGGVSLMWDSRALGADVGLGRGWSFGLARVEVRGGVWVHPPSGGAYAMDASVPGGLAGYPGSDVVFAAAEPGEVVPARADGVVGERAYAFVLHELGGVVSYFDATGVPLTRMNATGERMDWGWDAGVPGRLVSVVSAEGVHTAVDWSDPARVVVSPGANVVAPGAGSGVGGQWVVELSGGRVSAVVDPVGGQVTMGYDRSGVIERMAAPSGAVTELQWQWSADSVARVSRVRVRDAASGAEVSAREWGAGGEVSPSGWPLVSAPAGAGTAGPGFESWVSDGKSRVVSVVDGEGLLTGRSMVVSSASGERVVQEQVYEYPESDGRMRSGAETKPVAASTSFRNGRGGVRSLGESYEFDRFGRMVSRTAADGSVLRRLYDETVPLGRALPVGLVVEESTTAPDGLVAATRSELNADRVAVVATEQWAGRAGEELVRTGRVESDVSGGFVTEKRVFPAGDPGAVPAVSRWSKRVDVAAGTSSIEETVGADTASEASTVTVTSLVHGGTLSERDAVGNVTRARYDLSGRRTSVVDASGRERSTEYRTRQRDGVNAVTETDAVGVAVTEERDVLGRVVRKSDNIGPDGRVADAVERVFESFEYPEPGVERATDAWGGVTTTERDVFGRISRVRLPGGLVQVAEFDDVAGTATSGVSLTGELADAVMTSTNVLDTSGRVTGTTGTRADGIEVPETSTVFDGLGREVEAVDGSRRTRTAYDALGDPVMTEVAPLPDIVGTRAAPDGASAGGDPTGPAAADRVAPAELGTLTGLGVRAEREFDGFGSSVEKTLRSADDVAAGHRRVLDVLGRTVSQTDQRGVTERTAYTPDGLVAEVVSDTGRTIRNAYDPVTRDLVETRTSDAAGAVATGLRVDRAGRVVAVFDPANEAGTLIGYDYDAFGNVTRTVYPDGAEIRHEYDPHGRRTATIDVDGNRTEYAYDATDGALAGVSQFDDDGRPVSGVRYVYDEYRRARVVERDNGVRTEYTFTSAAEIASEVTTGPDGTVRSEREYEYTPTGNLSSRIDRVRDSVAAQLVVTRTDYEYDGFDRLIGSSVREGDGPAGSLVSRAEYEPTLAGDLASETITTPSADNSAPRAAAEKSSERRFEYSATGELIAITTDGVRREQSFDADGNLTRSAAGASYEYDPAGRLVAQIAPDGTAISTTYWADGSRREHTTGAASTRYYWDDGELITEVHRTSEVDGGTASYLIGANRIARTTTTDAGSATVSYYGTDRHGNVTDLTDQRGTVTTTYGYTDYGTLTSGQGASTLPAGIGELGYNPFQYSGEYTYRDGSQSLGVRLYDPAQARFTTEDDAALANLYAYTDLNPITSIDPTGRTTDEDLQQLGAQVAGIVLAVVGAALLLTTPGSLFTGLGALGFVLALGDTVLATVEIVESLIDDKFFPDEDLRIATWALFGASAVLTGAGVVGKLVTSRKIMRGCLDAVPCSGVRSTKGYRALRGSSSSSSDSGEEVARLTQPSSVPLPRARERAITKWSDFLERENIELLQVLAVGVGGKTAKGHMRLAKTHLVNARDVARRQMALGFGDEIDQATIDANYQEMKKSLNSAYVELDGATVELPLLMDYSKRRGFAASQAYLPVRQMYVNLRRQGKWKVSSSSAELTDQY